MANKLSAVYLILSQSGRMLAKVAFEGGYNCVVIDQFGDVDTQRYALKVKTLPEFSDKAILGLITQFWEEYNCKAIILGSGLENRLALMQQLADRWVLSGNSIVQVSVLKDPMVFAALLRDRGIPHPQTHVTPPEIHDSRQRWLAKKTGGSGGEHVNWYSSEKSYSADSYFQQFIQGKSYSVVFLADGKRVKVLGYNRLWPTPTLQTGKDAFFRFNGAISLSGFHDETTVEKMLNDLVGVVKFVGLCGADLIVDEEGVIYLLEINPRPTATFDLHFERQSDLQKDNSLEGSQVINGSNLFHQHLEACQGRLPVRVNMAKNLISAKQIVYASLDLEIRNIDWPSWVSDIPQPDTQIKTGQPICTIYAFAESGDEVEKRLENQCDMINALL